MRNIFIGFCLAILILNGVGYFYFPWILYSLIFFGPIIIVGTHDLFQTRHTILRNFPILGHFRYLFEAIRPEINQYFVESNSDGVPFSREQRSIVYQRAKKVLDTLPFGTQKNVYQAGYEWVNHSLRPIECESKDLRVLIGGPACKKPYSASILNIGAMSYGSLSKTAIAALNLGAKIGNFAHNTGEGSVSPHHVKNGGDLIMQIGTGYFGCRTPSGEFDPKKFQDRAQTDIIKMIEIKSSQGAKPGHGGILPAAKVSPEIAEIRGATLGQDLISPPFHSTFSTPIELIEYIQKLRELSGGKPIGFKLCLGKKREFLGICKAMIDCGITPDFITVDGGEGGTGAAPLEFSNSVGWPLREALIFVHNSLVGFSLRNKIKLIASGRVISAIDILTRCALGADLCYSARGMMLALGCIQALRCNSNHCPAGIATQNPQLYRGINVENKGQRVANFHDETIEAVGELLTAMAIKSTDDLKPWHIMRRTQKNEIKDLSEIHEFLEDGSLLGSDIPESFMRSLKAARSDSFDPVSNY